MLNPEWVLKPDKGRVVLVRVTLIGIEGCIYIHPGVAFILSLFNGRRTIAQVKEIVKHVGGLSQRQLQSCFKLVNALRKQIPNLLVPAKDGVAAILDPRQFLIPADKIDVVPSRRLATPLMLVLMPTYRCPVRCIYCYAERRRIRRELSLRRVKEILDEAAELGVLHITLSGGDPFMRPDILDILAHMYSLGFKFMPATKCELSYRIVRRLADIGIEWVQVSVDCHEPLIADLLTGTKGYLERARRTISRLTKCGINVRINAVLTSLNAKFTVKFAEWLIRLGVRQINFARYSRSAYRHNSDVLFISDAEGKGVQEHVKALRERYPDIEITTDAGGSDPFTMIDEQREAAWQQRSLCTAGTQGLVIAPDGKVTVCEQLPTVGETCIGDVSKDSIASVWNSEKLFEIIYPSRERFRGTVCYDCPDFEACHKYQGRCLRDAFRAYGTIWAPAPLCPKAVPGARLL